MGLVGGHVLPLACVHHERPPKGLSIFSPFLSQRSPPNRRSAGLKLKFVLIKYISSTELHKSTKNQKVALHGMHSLVLI